MHEALGRSEFGTALSPCPREQLLYRSSDGAQQEPLKQLAARLASCSSQPALDLALE